MLFGNRKIIVIAKGVLQQYSDGERHFFYVVALFFEFGKAVINVFFLGAFQGFFKVVNILLHDGEFFGVLKLRNKYRDRPHQVLFNKPLTSRKNFRQKGKPH
jgi:hypothetical protein